jgi:hypothetical protein
MRGGDAHRADVRRAFVGPEGQLHGQAARPASVARAAQRPGEQLGQVGGLLEALDRA